MSRPVQVLACALCLAVGSAIFPADRQVGAVSVIDGDRQVGVVSVIDGDTLDLHGTRIRLWGIDAPERRQLCQRDGEPWRCGQAAALALADRIGRQPVHCEVRDIDRWKRLIALCRQGGQDLSEWLVRSGLALAFRRYAKDYVAVEDEARAERVGLWAGEFAPPWNWRRDRGARLITAEAQ